MEFYVAKKDTGLMPRLVPLTDDDAEKLKKVGADEVVKCTVVKARSAAFHRKFFGLLSLVLDNIPDDAVFEATASDGSKQVLQIKTVDDLLFHVKCQAGLMESAVTLGGKVLYIPKSISFAKMDDFAFSEFYSKAVDVCLKFFLKGVDKAALQEEVALNFG